MTKKIILTLLLLIGLFITISTVSAALTPGGLREAAIEAKLPRTSFTDNIGKIIAAGLSLLGVVFFGLLIYAGFEWMTARGNQEKTSSALNTIINAVIGIIIVLSAYVATNFVFDNLKKPATDSTPTTAVSTCTKDSECTTGQKCTDGKCVSDSNTCAADSLDVSCQNKTIGAACTTVDKLLGNCTALGDNSCFCKILSSQ